MLNTKSKINDLDIVSIINEYILKLQIPVAYFLAMKISDSLSDLPEEMNDNLFRQDAFLAFIFDILIKAYSRHILLDQVNFFRGLK